MKIGSLPSIANLNTYAKVKCTNATPEITVQRTDQLEIAQSDREFQRLLKAAKNVPAVRCDKVEEIKRRIEAGAYHVDSRAVAEKIIEQTSQTTTRDI